MPRHPLTLRYLTHIAQSSERRVLVWSSKSALPQSCTRMTEFNRIFAHHQYSVLVLSYLDPGLPDCRNELLALAPVQIADSFDLPPALLTPADTVCKLERVVCKLRRVVTPVDTPAPAPLRSLPPAAPAAAPTAALRLHSCMRAGA